MTDFNFFLQGRGSIPIGSGARDVAAILDTALLQALLLTGQSSAALELLKGLNYCDVKICEEILQKRNHFTALLELYRCNAMHRDALKLLHQLIEDSKSNQVQSELTHKFNPEAIIEYLKVSSLKHILKHLSKKSTKKKYKKKEEKLYLEILLVLQINIK